MEEKLHHEIAKKDKEIEERDNEIEFLKAQLENQFDQSMPLEEDERSKKCKLSDIAYQIQDGKLSRTSRL